MTRLAAVLAQYGAKTSQILPLTGKLRPETVGYADIVQATTDRPQAVVREATGAPIAYVVDGRRTELDPESIARLRRVTAFRGEGSFLAVVYPGRLDLFDASLTRAVPGARPLRSVEVGDDQAKQVFPRLDLVPEVADSRHLAIHEALRTLMREAIYSLHSPRTRNLRHVVSRQDALSLVGRAVFVRFLLDRGLLSSENLREISPEAEDARQLFDSPRWISRTFNWLDETFNGDLLPISFSADEAELSRRIQGEGLTSLGNILRDAPGGQLPLRSSPDGTLTWSGLDFSRIPVGVLSQVYEQQAHDWDPAQSQDKSVYYTPTTIASFMVSEVFQDLVMDEASLNQLRILDPAVGGGVFLVEAFRKLVARHWQVTKTRPGTLRLRHMVGHQLFGFDVEKAALQFTALSLYLAAIELDPEPKPLQRLRFEKPLVGTSLLFVGGKGPAGQAGSLGSRVGPEHNGTYDVVIGNPPWTSEKIKKNVQKEMVDVLAPIAERALGNPSSGQLVVPDGNPDVGFLWRALQWCRPGGHLALVVHGRLLFKQSEIGCAARGALLDAFAWTGVLNGAAVRQTEVWPNVSAPFALIFGVNEPPTADGGFHYFSPYLEENLNSRGRMRIDAKDAKPVRLRAVRETPFLLKALFRGSALDLSLARRVERAGPKLGDYWREHLGLKLGHGYQVAAASGRQDARFLINLPDVTHKTVGQSPEPRLGSLPKFRRAYLWRPRKPEIYKGPLVLVRKSIPADDRKPSVFIADTDAAYSESFYGLSAHGHSRGLGLARYVALILSTPLMRWYSLMTSGQYGVERDALYFEDVKRLPIPPYDDLPENQRSACDFLWREYAAEQRVTERHATWVQELYGLSVDDWQVIQDTLAVSEPRRRSAKQAMAPPTRRQVEIFVSTLQSTLQKALGVPIRVEPGTEPTANPWLDIHLRASSAAVPPGPRPTAELEAAAAAVDHYSAAKVRVVGEGSITVLLLRQFRFWTPSRARLEALEMLHDRCLVEVLAGS